MMVSVLHWAQRLGGLVLIFVVVQSRAESSQLYKYLIEGLPRPAAACSSEADRLAAEFKRQSGSPLASGKCLAQDDQTYDIEIDYPASKRVKAVSTIEFVGGAAASWQGSYHTRTSCETTLPEHQDQFQRETGLSPLVAFCYRESNEPRHAWVMRIDAFGKTKRPAMVDNIELFGYVVGDLDAIEHELEEYTKNKTTSLASIALRPFASDDSIRLVYFAPKLLPFRHEVLGEYQDQSDCLRAKGLMEPELTSLPSPPPLLCVNDTLLGYHSIQLFQVKTGGYLDLVPYPKSYPSESSCEADKSSAREEVEKSMGAPTVTATCGRKSGEIRMVVLVRQGTW